MKKLRFSLPALLLALSLAMHGCDKEGSLQADIEIVPWLEMTKGGEKLLATSDVVVFAHNVADTTAWYVADYDDALTGLITPLGGGEKKTPDFSGRISMDGNLQFGPVTQQYVFLVACNRNGYGELESRMYGYRGAEIAAGLPHVRISLVFRPWEERERFVDSKWQMCNENPYKAPEEEGNETE